QTSLAYRRVSQHGEEHCSIIGRFEADCHCLALHRHLRREAYLNVRGMFRCPAFETRQLVRPADRKGETVFEGHGENPGMRASAAGTCAVSARAQRAEARR